MSALHRGLRWTGLGCRWCTHTGACWLGLCNSLQYQGHIDDTLAVWIPKSSLISLRMLNKFNRTKQEGIQLENTDHVNMKLISFSYLLHIIDYTRKNCTFVPQHHPHKTGIIWEKPGDLSGYRVSQRKYSNHNKYQIN